jgi:hypothetical protein
LHNRAPLKSCKSGVAGVRQIRNGTWQARVTVNYKEIHLGTFATFEEAVKAREEFNVTNIGEFVRSV